MFAVLSALAFQASHLQADEPTAPPREVQLFNGKDLTGWRVADKFWFEKHGPVEVVKGELILAAGKPGTGIVYADKLPRDEYELTIEAQRIAGDDFFCGLTFPVGDSYCTLILGGWGGSVTGLSNVDDFAAVENETTGSFDFKNGRWYTIRLRVTKERIQAWIDQTEQVDLARKDHRFGIWWEQEPLRPLGLAAWNTKAAIRKIQLKRL